MDINILRGSQAGARTDRSSAVARAAVLALYNEVCLYPKPGLVSKLDNGSHQDMNAALFVKSLFALRHFFRHCHVAGLNGRTFEHLQELGLAAEACMRRATGGVNTHRGAIFNLGILCATVGVRDAMGRGRDLSRLAVECWANGIKAADSASREQSNGARVCQRYAVGGARGEAAAGFPHVFLIGLPALRQARLAACTPERAAIQAFFSILASLNDTNLLHRGGVAGLAFAHEEASRFLASGGVLACDWRHHATLIHHHFVERKLSPGGCADLLAATLFVDHILGSESE